MIDAFWTFPDDETLAAVIDIDNSDKFQHSIAKVKDINARLSINHQTLLHLALAGNRPRVAKILIRRQADINAKTISGKNPLHFLHRDFDDKEVLELLLPGNLNQPDNNGNTPIFFVHNPKIFTWMVWKGANPFVINKKGKTLLHVLMKREDSGKIGKLLVNYISPDGKVIDVLARDNKGRTAIQIGISKHGYKFPYLHEIMEEAEVERRQKAVIPLVRTRFRQRGNVVVRKTKKRVC